MFKDNIKTGTKIIIQDNTQQKEYLGVIETVSEFGFSYFDEELDWSFETPVLYNQHLQIERDKALHFLVHKTKTGEVWPRGFKMGEIWQTIYIKEV